MFREINLNSQDEYPIFASYTHFTTEEISTDKTMNKSIIEKTMFETKSFFKIEDHGEKQYGNSIVENYFGSVRIYEISMSDEKNILKIKCFRRYSNFVKLDKVLRQMFPYYIIPQLPPKNPLIKIKNYPADQEFYVAREKGLNYYINYIYSNNNLSNTTYFKKFINDPEFDEAFFDSQESIITFPVYDNYKQSIKSKVKNLFCGFFQKIEVSNDKEIKEEENVLNEYLEFFNKIIAMIESLMKLVAKFIKNFKNASTNYEDFSMNFFYLRDVEFEDFILEKDQFNKYSKKLKGISKININYSTLFEENLMNSLSNFLNQVKGIVESISIWNTFILKFKQSEAICKSDENNKELEEVHKEYSESKRFKSQFIITFTKEIKDFTSKNKNIIYEIMQELKNMLLYFGLHEKNQLLEEINQ